MLMEIVRTHVATSERTQQALLSAVTAGSFFWLLLQDQIHPLVVYLLQLYLAF